MLSDTPVDVDATQVTLTPVTAVDGSSAVSAVEVSSLGAETLDHSKREHSPSRDSQNKKLQVEGVTETPIAPEKQDLPSSDTPETKSQDQRGPKPQGGPKPPREPRPPKYKYKIKKIDLSTPMGVLQMEIDAILSTHSLTREQIFNDMKSLLNVAGKREVYHRVVENITIFSLTSSGDGVGLIPHPERADGFQVCLVPFAYPGDIVDAYVYRSHPHFVESDLRAVRVANALRKDELINCKYFGKCSGCQYQNLEYSTQLEFKKATIVNAYKFFAPVLLSEGKLPEVSETEPSPLEYGYRTKLTPHFNLPKKVPADLPKPPLGFGSKGRPKWRETEGGEKSVVDIEECVIATEIVNRGMKNERERYDKEFRKYKRAATILLRENTTRKPEGTVFVEGEETLLSPAEELARRIGPASTDAEGVITQLEVEVGIEGETKGTEIKTCVTDMKQIVREYVNGKVFEFSAGEFFQNNNAILPAVTSYVKQNLQFDDSAPNFLVDAYCGSGLFSITCSDGVSKVIGVEISADSVKFAERNAALNNVQNAKFITGKAEKIFGDLTDLPKDRTSVILDPPRKGCDDVFLNQLAVFNPARIVYISCNVHSQARDIEYFLTQTEGGKDYAVESIKGFDFFPQTHHVETIAVLRRK